ncbi:hypothetical protein BH11BAC6_BH11BAC6_05860 [soil metagenome]
MINWLILKATNSKTNLLVTKAPADAAIGAVKVTGPSISFIVLRRAKPVAGGANTFEFGAVVPTVTTRKSRETTAIGGIRIGS